MASRSDAELLEDLLAIEERLVSAYEAALRREAIEVALGEELRDHEIEHVRAIERALEGTGPRNPRASVPQSELTAALGSRSSFARFALDLEARALASYADAAASIRSPRLRQALGSIMACEAAHRVALRDALGDRPFVD